MNEYGDCIFCGGVVEGRLIEYDYRRENRLLIICNVPTGVCYQCGEKYFRAEVLKKMDALYHHIFDRDGKPERILQVPAISF